MLFRSSVKGGKGKAQSEYLFAPYSYIGSIRKGSNRLSGLLARLHFGRGILHNLIGSHQILDPVVAIA